jgi:hypothetical protein
MPIATAATLVVAAVVFFSASKRPAAAFGAVDTAAPTGTLAGLRASASGTLELLLSASDPGAGLAGVEASLDSDAVFVRLGTGSCPEHPLHGTEPPTGAECPHSVSAVPLALDTRLLPDGSHRLRVLLTDAAGNTAILADRMIVVRNAAPAGTRATLTLGVASGGEPGPPGKRKRGEGEPERLPPPRCRRPRLLMRLAAKPLWRTHPHHVPVLRSGRPYPYGGRLTCLTSSDERKPVPKGTRVGVFYRVWHRSFKRPRGPVRYQRLRKIKVRSGGRLKLRLRFRSGRTILFRYRGPEGETAKAKIRIAVPPRTRRPPWGPR